MATCPPSAGMINPIGLNPIVNILFTLPPINILIDWGSAGPPSSLGIWVLAVSLASNPGVGNDHTVTFNYPVPGQMSSASPPSMVFNSANWFTPQYITMNIINSGNSNIPYIITAIGIVYGGNTVGTIPINI